MHIGKKKPYFEHPDHFEYYVAGDSEYSDFEQMLDHALILGHHSNCITEAVARMLIIQSVVYLVQWILSMF